MAPCGSGIPVVFCAADEHRRVKVGRTWRDAQGSAGAGAPCGASVHLHPHPLAVQAVKGGTMRVRVSSLGCSRASRQRSEGRKVWGERGVGPGWMVRDHSCRRAHVPWSYTCFHAPSLPRLSLHPRRVVVHATKDANGYGNYRTAGCGLWDADHCDHQAFGRGMRGSRLPDWGGNAVVAAARVWAWCICHHRHALYAALKAAREMKMSARM
ncbi:hypothetical protein B0H10DRAFT_1959576 [Mycena sp. CBHHK59/15]|nr:hypothetical protein B0H10DRAFT_1959576 [Mycena sp. CBHHK59/15]